jgi:hypothetical protein
MRKRIYLTIFPLVALAGCGSSNSLPKNPEVAPTKAVLGNPSSLKFGGKSAPENAAPK